MNKDGDRLAQLPTCTVTCAAGFNLHQSEWAELGDECLCDQCPHHDTCEIKNREQKVSENK